MQLLDKGQQTYLNGVLYHYTILPSETAATKLRNIFFIPSFSFEWQRNANAPEYLPETVRVDVGLIPIYGRGIRQALLVAHNPWQDGHTYLLHALCTLDQLDYLQPSPNGVESRINTAVSIVVPFLAIVSGGSP